MKEEDLETVEKQLVTTYPEGSAVIMSLAEIFEAKGWEKGKPKEQRKRAWKSLKKRFKKV